MVVRRLQPKIARHILVLFLLPDRRPLDFTSQPHMLPRDIFLIPNISINNRQTSIDSHSFCFEDITMLLSVKDTVELGSSEAHECMTSDHVTTHSTHVVPPSTISIPSTNHVDDDGV
ncbi:hypothetical protein AAG906_040497 [Vitis piasezkii]